MKKLFAAFTAWAIVFAQLVTLTPAANAQSTIGASRVGDRYIAGNYNYGGSAPNMGAGNVAAPGIAGLVLFSGNGATGSSTITLRTGYFAAPDGRIVFPLCAGGLGCGAATSITVNPGGLNSETVTPTAVSGCTVYPQNTTSPSCQVTASFSNIHAAGELVQSGTAGFGEAANDAFINGGGTVVLGNLYQGTSANITGQVCFSNVTVEDTARLVSPSGALACRPTGNTPLAAGLAPVDAAATGGSMTSGTHRIMYEYVDINGQLGTQSAELADGNSRTGLVITAPAASTGAIGWIPCVTANGGATKTEKCFMGTALTSSICTLTKLTPAGITACAVANTNYGQTGANATILADVATTAPFIFGNSNLTAANDTGFQASSTTSGYVPVPASTAYLPFSPVYFNLANASSSNSTYEVMAWNLTPSFFNVLGKKWNFCLSYHATSAANSQTVTLNLRYGPYQNSDTVLIPLVTSAYSSTNKVDGKACADITSAVLGSSGTLNVHGQLVTNLAGTAALTWFTEATAANAATGVIGSLPLTTNQQLTLELVIGTGAMGSAITFDSISLEPVN